MAEPMPEQALDAAEALALRRAIALSELAASRGSRPFGAVIVGADGRTLAEGHNDNAASGDCTAHAEVMALRQAAAAGIGRAELAGATMLASGEPCVMCAGAIFWSGIRRVVFGIDAERLRGYRRAAARGRRSGAVLPPGGSRPATSPSPSSARPCWPKQPPPMTASGRPCRPTPLHPKERNHEPRPA